VTRFGELAHWVIVNILLVDFRNLTEVAQILSYFFPRYKLRINFDKKWFGQHFGRVFHKHIWPPSFGKWFSLRRNNCDLNIYVGDILGMSQ
jgi:hypothetical protein